MPRLCRIPSVSHHFAGAPTHIAVLRECLWDYSTCVSTDKNGFLFRSPVAFHSRSGLPSVLWNDEKCGHPEDPKRRHATSKGWTKIRKPGHDVTVQRRFAAHQAVEIRLCVKNPNGLCDGTLPIS